MTWDKIHDTSVPTNNADANYNWSLFISTILWSHTGWDCMGNLSSDIGFKKSKIFYAFLIAVILHCVIYVASILAASTVKCDNNCWDDGYLLVAFNNIIDGMSYVIAFSGMISCFCLYIVELSTQSRCIWSLTQPYALINKENGEMLIQGHECVYNEEMTKIENVNLNEFKKIRIGIFPEKYIGYIWERTGEPVGAILIQSFVNLFLVALNFETLVQRVMFINGLTYLLEMTAYLRLRYVEPNTRRPYIVPGGMFVAWLITIDKFILIFVFIVLTMIDDYIVVIEVVVFIIIVYFWYLFYKWYFYKLNI